MTRTEFGHITPCPAVHEDGTYCEREDGHPPPHWYTVWEADPETGQSHPSYPVQWGAVTAS